MELISKKDIMSIYNGPAPKLVVPLAMSLFGINHINKLYEATYNEGDQCAARLMSILHTTYAVDERELANIPKKGPCIIVSNHPTGGMDGVLLIDMLTKIRPDVMLMGNFVLQRIESLSRYFIPVDPYRESDPRGNIRGVKMAADHIISGGTMVVFPAGQVSDWSREAGGITDAPWRRSIMRFIRKSGAPVVPIYIEARNSRKFYFLGGIHPFIRTALLPREFTNKRHMKIPVRVGCPLIFGENENGMTLDELANILREKVYGLKKAQAPIMCDGAQGKE